jgi:hypothetical protein
MQKPTRAARCPLCGEVGEPRRQMTGAQLLSLYRSYLGKEFVCDDFAVPPQQQIQEYFSPPCGLVYYSPGLLGDGDYYALLNATYAWYYNPGSWDKQVTLAEIKELKPDWVLEVGCGDGWLLAALQAAQIPAIGIEANEEAVRACRARGLRVYRPQDEFAPPPGAGLLCLLQTIEHLASPLETLTGYLQQTKPRHVLLSAPCHESLLGHTSDPLVWPPHHLTCWSEKAFQTLADKTGCVLEKTLYSPLTYEELEGRLARENRRGFPGLSFFPRGRLGRFVFRLRRRLGFHWCLRGHSILVRLRILA